MKNRTKTGNLRKPELWLEEWAPDNLGGSETVLRIFYPDGTSEYLTLNRYFQSGNVLIVSSGAWDISSGNDWFPNMYEKEVNRKDKYTFLDYL